MSMFGALVPNQDTVIGTESYEEVVDNFCTALEDVENEISSFEALGESIDNAEAFAAAIESCGATPALLQFGYACDDSFEQLIGRAAPSDFATEDMSEFGSFALESIRSKLKLAWEAVKDFIIRLWEKLKEFGRWIISLFDRKEQKLEALRKAAVDKKAKGKPFKKADTRNVKCYTMQFLVQAADQGKLIGKTKAIVSGIAAAAASVAAAVAKGGASDSINNGLKTAMSIVDSVTVGGAALFTATKVGGIVVSRKVQDAYTSRTLQEAGYRGWDDIIAACDKAIKMLRDKREFDAITKEFGKLAAEATKQAKDNVATAKDIDNDGNDKEDRDDIIKTDTAKRQVIRFMRNCSLMSSKVSVLTGKLVNNIAASVIAVCKESGL